MDVGTYDLSGTKIMTVHPEHRHSLPSMAVRHTVHPEHKKAARYKYLAAFLQHKIMLIQNRLKRPCIQDI